MKTAHEIAIEWALSKGYCMSVCDYSSDVDEWDCEYSTDKAEIMECCRATELPNVSIFRGRDYLLTFSVIDDGIPAESINDYTVPRDDAEQWRIDAYKEFDRTVYNYFDEATN